MSLTTLQNFYKETCLLDWEAGAGNFYVSTKPVPTSGWLVISPANSSLREIVKYTATGTDSTGDYVTVTLANRGLGGTTAQTHTAGEPIRINYTAEHQQETSDAIDQIVAAGAQDASTTTKGLSKISVAPASPTEPIAVGDNDPRIPTQSENDALVGGGELGTPSSSNKFITEDYLSNTVDVQVYTANDTWTKPTGVTFVKVICIGAGGSGGGGRGAAVNNRRKGGSGGGGGAITEKIFRASDLADTVDITVPNASVGGAGGNNADGSNGNSGGNASFGNYLIAYGGGAGGGGNSINQIQAGGSGGGSGGAGNTGGGTSDILGGLPALTVGISGISGQGAGSSVSTGTSGRNSEFGGAGGGQVDFDSGGMAGRDGGSSLYGGSAGGGGRGLNTSNAVTSGGAGGTYGSYTPGGGGAVATTDSGASGTAGTSRSGYGCGDGGGGGGVHASSTGGAGGAGGAPGGGGGGGGGGTSTGGAGGAGGRGEVRVFSW